MEEVIVPPDIFFPMFSKLFCMCFFHMKIIMHMIVLLCGNYATITICVVYTDTFLEVQQPAPICDVRMEATPTWLTRDLVPTFFTSLVCIHTLNKRTKPCWPYHGPKL